MAERDDRTYKIIVPLPGDKKSAMASSGSSSAKKTQDDKTAQGAINAVKGIVSYSSIRAHADQIVGYNISQVNLRTGAAEYQQKLQFEYSALQSGLNLIDESIKGYFVGGAIGSVIGIGASLTNTFVGWIQRAGTLSTEQNLESISLNFASIRAGVSGRRSSSQ